MWNKQNLDTELAAKLDELLSTNESLSTKAALLISENHYLRRKYRVQPYMRIAQRAIAAAQKMVMLHLAGYRTGRNACLAAGISERTFYPARSILILARVHDSKKFLAHDPVLIEQRLSNTITSINQHPESLFSRIPRSKRPKIRELE